MKGAKSIMNWPAVGLIIVLVGSLVGCQSTPPPAPVSMIGERGKTHVVRRGETLYAIAWRYGLDYRALARSNGISKPYTIYVGQRVRLASTAKQSKKGASNPRVATAPARAVYKEKPVSKPPAPVAPSRLSWQWPIEGEVTSKFSLSGKVNKGIDVRASEGNAVRAAADGSVVYAGGNLRGYGKLVIVKHDATFLSAYGNNEALTVKEGDTVTKGQEIGRLGGDQVLHFEIRRDGRPEDPEQHLP